jgi:hypothetical protein
VHLWGEPVLVHGHRLHLDVVLGVEERDRGRLAVPDLGVGFAARGHVSGGQSDVDAGSEVAEVGDHVATEAGVDLQQARAT